MTVRILQQTLLHEGWGRYLLLKVALPDGAVVERQVDDHGSAVAVLPFDPGRRTVLLARLIRIGPLFAGEEPHLVEAPAGRREAGETPEACARREVMEEVGVRLGELVPLGRSWPSPGVCTERLDLFLAPYAAGDRIGPGGGVPEEHEGIEVVEMGIDELWRDVQSGALTDMKTLLLAYALHARRPDLFG